MPEQSWPPFTPADVVAAYKKHAVSPVFHQFEASGGRCCALTAIAKDLGGGDLFHRAQEAWPDLVPWPFVFGFDAVRSPLADTPSYQLGLACREAVLEAFPDAVQSIYHMREL